jgi:hypothetical protein
VFDAQQDVELEDIPDSLPEEGQNFNGQMDIDTTIDDPQLSSNPGHSSSMQQNSPAQSSSNLSNPDNLDSESDSDAEPSFTAGLLTQVPFDTPPQSSTIRTVQQIQPVRSTPKRASFTSREYLAKTQNPQILSARSSLNSNSNSSIMLTDSEDSMALDSSSEINLSLDSSSSDGEIDLDLSNLSESLDVPQPLPEQLDSPKSNPQPHASQVQRPQSPPPAVLPDQPSEPKENQHAHLGIKRTRDPTIDLQPNYKRWLRTVNKYFRQL